MNVRVLFDAPPPPPQNPLILRLILDEDFDFSHLAPPAGGGDAEGFLPGSVKGGTSWNVGAIRSPSSAPGTCAPSTCSGVVQLVAFFARANSPNQWEAPPPNAQVKFSLTDSSKWQGFASNATWEDARDNASDFALVAPNPGGGWGAENEVELTVPFVDGAVARVGLRVKDYGGKTTVGAVALTAAGEVAVPLQLPKDSTNNWLPDVGWKAPFVSGNTSVNTSVSDSGSAGVDNDDRVTPAPTGQPVGIGLVGDGLNQFEEYRGFVVRGAHRRTSPMHKDLFVATMVARPGLTFAQSLEFAATSFFAHGTSQLDYGIRLHHLFHEGEGQGTEYDRASGGLLNFAFLNAGMLPSFPHTPQLVVRIQPGPLPLDPMGRTIYGQTHGTCVNGGMTPNDLSPEGIVIDVADVVADAGNNNAINNELRRVTGHEVGHAVHVKHRPTTNTCDDGAQTSGQQSMMTDGLANGAGPNNQRSRYNDPDVAQMRFHHNGP
jgi:hypothetical protein